jgi:hypothetical protein
MSKTSHTDEQRTRAAQLIAAGKSNRAIAAQPGMPSRETVRRWRTELAEAAHTGTPHGTPGGTAVAAAQIKAHVPPSGPDVPLTDRDEAGGPPSDTPGTPTVPPTTADLPDGTPPGTHTLTLWADTDLREDLAVLAETGLTPQGAVDYAVRLLADAYRSAWDHDHYDRGTRPAVRMQVLGGRPLPTPPSARRKSR